MGPSQLIHCVLCVYICHDVRYLPPSATSIALVDNGHQMTLKCHRSQLVVSPSQSAMCIQYHTTMPVRHPNLPTKQANFRVKLRGTTMCFVDNRSALCFVRGLLRRTVVQNKFANVFVGLCTTLS